MLTNRINVTDPIPASELVLNPDGSVYHLKLKDEHIADTVIVVGDQNRVARISQHFTSIECKIENREFVTHTGTFNGKRVTALSTGIGADNLDIVVNELDAAVNIDPETRLPKDTFRQLNIVRLGTSGALHADIPVDSYLLSEYGLGFDGVANFYDCEYEADELLLESAFLSQVDWHERYNHPYFVRADKSLFDKLNGEEAITGITITSNGFYGPQGRRLLLNPHNPYLNDSIRSFKHEGLRITNYEMETAALYSLSALLGHKAATICAIIANRSAKKYSENYKITVDKLIEYTLERLTK